MNVHDQPSRARREEPLRAAARSRREARAPLARRAASPRDAHADNVPGWHARALRFWARRPSRSAGPAEPATQPVAPRWVLDERPSGLVITGEQERRQRRGMHDGLGPVLAGLTLGLDAALALPAGQPGLQNCRTRSKPRHSR